MSQLSDLSWLLVPTFGGSATLLGSSTPGNVGFLEVLEASDPSLPVDCLPVRSAFQQHVNPDTLLKMAPKNLILRIESVAEPPKTTRPGCTDLGC